MPTCRNALKQPKFALYRDLSVTRRDIHPRGIARKYMILIGVPDGI